MQVLLKHTSSLEFGKDYVWSLFNLLMSVVDKNQRPTMKNNCFDKSLETR